MEMGIKTITGFAEKAIWWFWIKWVSSWIVVIRKETAKWSITVSLPEQGSLMLKDTESHWWCFQMHLIQCIFRNSKSTIMHFHSKIIYDAFLLYDHFQYNFIIKSSPIKFYREIICYAISLWNHQQYIFIVNLLQSDFVVFTFLVWFGFMAYQPF